MINAGKLNRIITFEVWEYSQDNGGGAIGAVIDTWNQRAHILDRNSYRSALGAVDDSQAQQQWSFQFKVTVRKLTQQITSNMTFLYEGFRYVINEISVESEGHKRFYIIRASKTETWVGTS